jgi:hypothetical protein
MFTFEGYVHMLEHSPIEELVEVDHSFDLAVDDQGTPENPNPESEIEEIEETEANNIREKKELRQR